MKLSQRIYALCSQVDTGETVADIGTDHGYVPLLLIKNNISPYAIMADISRSSLSTAISSFQADEIKYSSDQFRVGDGLRVLEMGEVDAVIIAGLGGITISEIIEDDIQKTRSFKKLILQPRKHSGELRHCLDVNGFDIVKEVLVAEGKFVCEIIVAVPGDCVNRKEKYSEDDIRYSFPETFVNLEHDLVLHKISHKLSSIECELDSLYISKYDNYKLKSKLVFEKSYLEDLIRRNEES